MFWRYAPAYHASLLFFPFVGLVLGIIVYGADQLLILAGLQDSAFRAISLLCLSSLLTGFLHLDGVSDIADAFGGGKNREQVFRILKDCHKGSFGVAALIFVLLIKAVGWNLLLVQGKAFALPFILITGRTVQALMITFLPNAQPFSSSAARLATTSTTIRALLFLIALCSIWLSLLFMTPGAAVKLVLGCGGAIALFGWYCKRRIGGITGDCIGTGNEITEIVCTIALCSY